MCVRFVFPFNPTGLGRSGCTVRHVVCASVLHLRTARPGQPNVAAQIQAIEHDRCHGTSIVRPSHAPHDGQGHHHTTRAARPDQRRHHGHHAGAGRPRGVWIVWSRTPQELAQGYHQPAPTQYLYGGYTVDAAYPPGAVQNDRMYGTTAYSASAHESANKIQQTTKQSSKSSNNQTTTISLLYCGTGAYK